MGAGILDSRAVPPLLPSRSMKKMALFLTSVALVLVQPAGGQTSFTALGQEIETLVRERFYDTARGESWAKENAGYARLAQARRGAHRWWLSQRQGAGGPCPSAQRPGGPRRRANGAGQPPRLLDNRGPGANPRPLILLHRP
jgi:hypothetical protein